MKFYINNTSFPISPLPRPKYCSHAWNLFFPRVVAKRHPFLLWPLRVEAVCGEKVTTQHLINKGT